MKIDRRTLVGCALFVGGYLTFTLLDELLAKKKPLGAELVTSLALFVGAVVAGLVIWEAVLRFKDRNP